MLLRALVLLLICVAACAPRTVPYRTAARPNDAAYAAAVPTGHTHFSNASLAGLFTDLLFDTEWGETVPQLLRLDAPVAVALQGPGSERYAPFLDTFLAQIRREAGVAISRSAGPHALNVQFVPGAEWAPLQGNQCIIVYGLPTWPEFLLDRGRYSDYRAVSPRELAERTVFIPNTNEPHEIRECLIEEITQALGPSNDIYGLGPSIFNDDDAHVWPTRLDYLMLRVLYDDRMEAGIARREAEKRALAILNSINPDGREAPVLPPHRQMDFLAWRSNLHELFDLINAGQARTERASSILTSVLNEAEARAPDSPYYCEALSVAANLERERHSGRAGAVLARARRVCEQVHGRGDVRAADLRLSRAIVLLAEDRPRQALDEVDGLAELFLAYGQEALLALTHAVRWSALTRMNDPAAEEAHRLALAWSAYAFGDDHEAVARWRRF